MTKQVEQTEMTEKIIPVCEDVIVGDGEKQGIKEPELNFVQKIILCLMSAGLLFFAVSLHEYVPLIGLVAYLLYPIVVVNLTYKYGYVMVLGAIIIGHCFIGIAWDEFVAREATFGVGVISLLLGFCLRRGYSGVKTFFSVSGVYIGVLFLLQLVSFSNPILGVLGQEAFFKTVWARELMGDLQQELALIFYAIPDLITDSVEYLLRYLFDLLLPSVIIIQQMVLIWFYYFVAGFAMKKMGHTVNSLPAFYTWKMPRWFLGLFIANFVLGMFLGEDVDFYLLQVSLTLFSVGLVLFLSCGLSLLWYYLRYSKVSIWIKIISAVLCLYLLKASATAVAILAMLDSLLDFRKLKTGKIPGGAPAVTEAAAALEWEKQQMAQAVQQAGAAKEREDAATENMESDREK